MGIFAAAALAAFLMSAPLFLPGRARDRVLMGATQFKSGLVVLALLIIAVGLLQAERHNVVAWPIAKLMSGPEPLQAILGLMFGVIFRFWVTQLFAAPRAGFPSGEPTSDSAEGNRKVTALPSLYLAAVLGVLLVFGVASPYADELFKRMTGVKTPWGEAVFTTATVTRSVQVALDRVDRRNKGVKQIESALAKSILVEDRRWIDLRLDSPSDAVYTRRVAVYKGTEDFLKLLLVPLVHCVEAGRRTQQDPEMLLQHIRPVATRLRDLVSAKSIPTGDAHDRFVLAVRDAIGGLQGLPGVTCDKFALESWPKTLIPARADKTEHLTEEPHLHLALGLLLEFSGNVDGAITILNDAAGTFPSDMNVNFNLGRLRYVAEKPFSEIFGSYDKALEVAQTRGAQINDALERAGTDDARKQKLQELKARFARASILMQDEIAYLSAESGHREKQARQYAEDNLKAEALKTVVAKSVGESDFYRGKFLDTQGYVKLAFAVRRDPPNTAEIREAKTLFEEAEHHAERSGSSVLRSRVEKHRALALRLLAQ